MDNNNHQNAAALRLPNAAGISGSRRKDVSTRRSPWAVYQRVISERPLLTKSITAAFLSAVGEVAGSALRPTPKPTLPVSRGANPIGSRDLLPTLSSIASRAGSPGASAAAAGPGLLRRTAAFALFGLVFNGPVFHWWYGALERIAARNRKPGHVPGNAREVALKVALDRLVLTPPYLAFTLFALRVLEGWGLDRSARETRALYRGVLVTNWKVWTLAQLVNFNLVPVEFRAGFGNIVACWWNIYLSLLPKN